MIEEEKDTQKTIESSPVDSQEETGTETVEKKSKPSKGLIWLRNIVVGIVILFLVAFFLYVLIPSPTKTVRNFFYALMNENYPKAYSYVAKDYKKSRGSLEKFTFDYDNAVRSGTRTRAIRITEEKKTANPNQRVVIVEIDVLYQGNVVTSVGAYLCEKIPSEGWKIVGNVTTEYNKGQAQKLVPQEQ